MHKLSQWNWDWNKTKEARYKRQVCLYVTASRKQIPPLMEDLAHTYYCLIFFWGKEVSENNLNFCFYLVLYVCFTLYGNCVCHYMQMSCDYNTLCILACITVCEEVWRKSVFLRCLSVWQRILVWLIQTFTHTFIKPLLNETQCVHV